MVFGEDLGGVGLDFPAQVELEVRIHAYFRRVTDTRCREDIVHKVLYVIVVGAAIGIETIWFQISLCGLSPLDPHVLTKKLGDADLRRDLCPLQPLCGQVECPEKMLKKQVIL